MADFLDFGLDLIDLVTIVYYFKTNFFVQPIHCLLNKIKAPKKLVQGPGVRKKLSVIESYS